MAILTMARLQHVRRVAGAAGAPPAAQALRGPDGEVDEDERKRQQQQHHEAADDRVLAAPRMELPEPQQAALGVGVQWEIRSVRHGPAVGGVVDEGDGGEEHVDGARDRDLVRRLVALGG